MAEYPALPLWTDAYLGDTTHLTTIEHGAYLLLLFGMWRSGDASLPADDKALARYARLTMGQWQRIRPTVIAFFTVENGRIKQGRLTDEFNRLRGISNEQSAKAKARWGNRRDNANKRSERIKAARAIGTHTPQEWEILKEIFKACVGCGTTEYPLEKDHIIPVYQGGSDAIENIQPFCARCNARKGSDSTDRREFVRPNWQHLFYEKTNKSLNFNKMSAAGSMQNDSRSDAPTPTPTSVSKDTGASEQTDLLGDHAPIVLQPKSMKAVIWQNAKLIFESAGVAKTTAGKIIGKLAAEYGDDVLVAALVAMEKERPADPTSWLMAACKAKKGKNGHPVAEWREEWVLTDELANYSRSKIKTENSKSVFDRFRTVVMAGRGQVSQWPQDFRDFVDREAAKFSR